MNRFWKMKLPAFLLAMVMVIGMVPAASAASKVSITYEVDPDDEVTVDAEKFWKLFDDKWDNDDTFKYLKFTDYDNFDSYGYFYAEDEDKNDVKLKYRNLDSGKLYYNYREVSRSNEYDLDTLTFAAYDDADEETLEFKFTLYGKYGEELDGTLYIEIGDGDDADGGDITVEVDADDEETVSAKSFKFFFDKKSNETFSYMYFDKNKIPSKLDSYGYFYSRNSRNKETAIKADALEDAEFYYDSNDVGSSGEYTLDDLTFVADEDAGGKTVSLPFYAVGDEGEKVKGTLTIKIGKSSGSSSKKGDITYTAGPSKEAEFDEDDFYDFLDDNYGKDLKYVVFTDASGLKSSTGYVYYRYDTRSEVEFDDDLEDYYFYYDKKSNVPSDADEDEIYPPLRPPATRRVLWSSTPARAARAPAARETSTSNSSPVPRQSSTPMTSMMFSRKSTRAPILNI